MVLGEPNREPMNVKYAAGCGCSDRDIYWIYSQNYYIFIHNIEILQKP